EKRYEATVRRPEGQRGSLRPDKRLSRKRVKRAQPERGKAGRAAGHECKAAPIRRHCHITEGWEVRVLWRQNRRADDTGAGGRAGEVVNGERRRRAYAGSSAPPSKQLAPMYHRQRRGQRDRILNAQVA